MSIRERLNISPRKVEEPLWISGSRICGGGSGEHALFRRRLPSGDSGIGRRHCRAILQRSRRTVGLLSYTVLAIGGRVVVYRLVLFPESGWIPTRCLRFDHRTIWQEKRRRRPSHTLCLAVGVGNEDVDGSVVPEMRV